MNAQDVNAILSLGGWGGSCYFSSSVGSAENRTAFAKTVMAAVSKYNLDGVEFDWEYPAKQGAGCNIVATDDSANFLAFLKELRAQDGADNLLVSAAVSLTPFIGSDGQPMNDVSAFADVLDTIEVMDYDVWGSWSSTVGPNAPLYDDCAPEAEGSAASALAAWTGAGFPVGQIILGVASYGHSFSVTKSSALLANGSLALYPSFNSSNQPAGDKWDSTADGGTIAAGTRIPLAVSSTSGAWWMAGSLIIVDPRLWASTTSTMSVARRHLSTTPPVKSWSRMTT